MLRSILSRDGNETLTVKIVRCMSLQRNLQRSDESRVHKGYMFLRDRLYDFYVLTIFCLLFLREIRCNALRSNFWKAHQNGKRNRRCSVDNQKRPWVSCEHFHKMNRNSFNPIFPQWVPNETSSAYIATRFEKCAGWSPKRGSTHLCHGCN